MATARPAPEAGAVAVIALGGGLGSLARYGLAELVPTSGPDFPIATLTTNLLGSFLLGLLVVAVTEIWSPHRLVRPALGTGVLGGFTTFSTFAVQVRSLPLGTSLGYLVASVVGGVLAAALGMSLMPRLTSRRSTNPSRPSPGGPAYEIDPDLP